MGEGEEKMRKILALLGVFALTFSLAACKKKEEAKKPAEEGKAPAAEQKEGAKTGEKAPAEKKEGEKKEENK